jgi:hypothetical protein
MQTDVNDHLILVSGKSTTGKSASIMNLERPENWAYLNCEAGKRLPFRSKFKEFTITDPLQVYEAFDWAETQDNIEGIVVDSVTFLMDMFESVHVINSTNTMKAWGEYAQFFKNLMQVYVARSTKNVIFTAHALDQLNEADMVMETKVPVKGSLKNNGIESYFSAVVSAKKMTIKALEGYENDLLTVTPEDEALGFKYVFQTKLTKETVGERIRAPMGLWSTAETYIDNDMQLVMHRLHEYYGTEAAA